MKAVSDTSPLGYLILIAQSELLPKAARAVASLRGLHLSGTLGILADAGRRKLVDLPQVVADLQKTSFRARPDLLRKLLEQEP